MGVELLGPAWLCAQWAGLVPRGKPVWAEHTGGRRLGVQPGYGTCFCDLDKPCPSSTPSSAVMIQQQRRAPLVRCLRVCAPLLRGLLGNYWLPREQGREQGSLGGQQSLGVGRRDVPPF